MKPSAARPDIGRSTASLAAIPVVAVVITAGVSACSSDGGDAFDTLPPIRTSTTSTSSTLPDDQRVRVYVVQEGENLSIIANAFGVPVDFIIDNNRSRLPDPNNVQPGTMLEIPPFVFYESLPDPPASTEPLP